MTKPEEEILARLVRECVADYMTTHSLFDEQFLKSLAGHLENELNFTLVPQLRSVLVQDMRIVMKEVLREQAQKVNQFLF